MNTAGGSVFGGGNFEMFGLPATSNLFTIDGAGDNDPYFNINNSGATNLTLGLNDIQEATVVANGYGGQYGGLAGANINYATKYGTNNYHGNLVYWWNGDKLDANTYFFNQGGTPRAFVNANQYAGSLGGPIKKDKAFFFFDYEGIRLVIPSPLSVNLPTQAFEQSVLSGAGGLPASDVPYYQSLFSLWNATPGYANAKDVLPGGGCSNYTALPAGTPCAVQLQTGGTAHTNDYLATGRVDVNLSNNDRLFLRVNHEHGLQATYTDPINSAFTAISDQPSWQAQLSETHNFGSNKVNNFLTSFTWYAAAFNYANPTAEQATLPYQVLFADGSLFNLNNSAGTGFPQGRNITQYQFNDDFSWAHGRHTIKFGGGFHRSDVTDLDLGFFSNTPLTEMFSLADFASGGSTGDIILQFFPTIPKAPIALYQLGMYLDDDVKVTNNLKVTLSVRADHLSNPVCQANCFQKLAQPFESMNHDVNAPVNQAVLGGQHTAFPSVTGLVWEPKIGFAWSPFGSHKTVLRGGAGVFVDALPTGSIINLLLNAPLDPLFEEFFAPLNPAAPGNLFQLAQADNAGFVANFKGGALSCNAPSAVPGSCVPAFNFYGAAPVVPPRYYEWSLEVQREIAQRTTVSAKYVGNHGSHEAMANPNENAFGFANFPALVPDARLAQVTQIANLANSNYNGMVLSVQHAGRGGFQFQASYTYSHALDEISNNPFTPFGLTPSSGGNDIVDPQDPFNIRKYNYASADYDLRHYFSMNYVWSDAFRHLTSHGPNVLLKGWNFSGTIFYHTGYPYTVFSSGDSSTASSNFYGGVLFANQVGPQSINCGASAAQISNPCLNSANFSDPLPNYGAQRRNQFRGPGFFNTDFGGDKSFGLPKWEGASFSIGARVFNLFNHPNFNFPISDLDNSQFGQILSTVSTPTGIFGSGLGANNSPRLIQLQAKIVF